MKTPTRACPKGVLPSGPDVGVLVLPTNIGLARFAVPVRRGRAAALADLLASRSARRRTSRHFAMAWAARCAHLPQLRVPPRRCVRSPARRGTGRVPGLQARVDSSLRAIMPDLMQFGGRPQRHSCRTMPPESRRRAAPPGHRTASPSTSSRRPARRLRPTRCGSPPRRILRRAAMRLEGLQAGSCGGGRRGGVLDGSTTTDDPEERGARAGGVHPGRSTAAAAIWAVLDEGICQRPPGTPSCGSGGPGGSGTFQDPPLTAEGSQDCGLTVLGEIELRGSQPVQSAQPGPRRGP